PGSTGTLRNQRDSFGPWRPISSRGSLAPQEKQKRCSSGCRTPHVGQNIALPPSVDARIVASAGVVGQRLGPCPRRRWLLTWPRCSNRRSRETRSSPRDRRRERSSPRPAPPPHPPSSSRRSPTLE